MIMAQEEVITGLDIGTSKVCAVIAEINDAGQLQVLGVGRARSDGLRAGVVVNIESTLKSVAAAIEAAEEMAGREVRDVHIGIAGAHVEGTNSKGVVAISTRGREITPNDVARVMECARAFVLPADKEIVHAIPQEYIVDSTPGVKNPVDMIGARLEAKVHLITASVTAGQNLVKCVDRAGFNAVSVSLSSLAAGKAVLTKDEMEMGCLFIDIGGGTSDILLYRDGAPTYTAVLPMGGDLVSHDISIILKTTIENAEHLKCNFGCTWFPLMEDPSEPAVVGGFVSRNPMKVTRGELCEFIQPRMYEIFSLIRQKVEREGNMRTWSALGAGIVLTGGTAMLPGIVELASEVFGIHAHIGIPLLSSGVVDEARRTDTATAVGLVLERVVNTGRDGERAPSTERKRKNVFKDFFKIFF
jgi:cell division protein FtsA